MSIQRRNSDRKVQNVQAVQPLRSVQTPTSFLPRAAVEDEEGKVTFASPCLCERSSGFKISTLRTRHLRGKYPDFLLTAETQSSLSSEISQSKALNLRGLSVSAV